MYVAEFEDTWNKYFKRLDLEIRERVSKKIKIILLQPKKKHLKRWDYFVGKVGQYRIAYKVFERENIVRFYFVGNHKEYERMYM